MHHINQIYINGEFVTPHGTQTLDLIHPVTGKVASQVILADEVDTQNAIAAAKNAFKTFRHSTKTERITHLRRLHQVFAENKTELTDVMMDEYGCPFYFADLLISGAVNDFKNMADILEDYDFEPTVGRSKVRLEGVVVVGVIIPWNSTTGFIATKVSAAISAGCTCVIKASEFSARQADLVARVFDKAGLPKGVVNFVTGKGTVVGTTLTKSPDVAKITFTGSTGVGKIIAKDAAYQGGSGGTPRYTDKPQNRIEDIRAAADFINTFKGVDSNRLGLLGICGGGGYSVKAAQTDKRFKSLATISLFNTGDVRRNGFMRSQKDTIAQRLADIAKVRAAEAAGGEIQYTPTFGQNMTAEQVAALPFELYRQGYEYYAQTHAHPNSQTNSTVDSLQDLMAFDANTQVELIDQPLLMIAGEKADTLYMTEEIFTNANGTTRKELYKAPNVTHMEMYWKQPYVNQASEKLTAFFGSTLKTAVQTP